MCVEYNQGTGQYTQYLYDAEGHRTAKVNANSMNGTLNCAMAAAGPVVATYLVGQAGEQLTEFGATGNWVHTNVFAGGQLLATYDTNGLHFPVTDPLGTVRVQVAGLGYEEEYSTSLPYGDGLITTPNPLISNTQDATEHHFTGKEHDAESGLDYFGARYYASNMGRFMSPDWSATAEPVPYAKLGDPQSLNLYSYVGNNPISLVDADGHDENTGEQANVFKGGDASALTDGTPEGNAAYAMLIGFFKVMLHNGQ